MCRPISCRAFPAPSYFLPNRKSDRLSILWNFGPRSSGLPLDLPRNDEPRKRLRTSLKLLPKPRWRGHSTVGISSSADNRFHTAIYAASRNPFVITVLSSVREIQANTVAMAVSTSGSIEIAAPQHERIAAAIAASDPDLAEAAMAEHVNYSIEALKIRLGLPPEERDRLDLRWPSFPSSDGDDGR